MTVREIVPRRHAIADVHDIICYYREHAGTATGENFAIEIDEAYARLSKHPNIGSPRPAYDLEMEGLKSWALKRFPHQIYYNVHDDHVELWRILHPRRDITQAMLDDRWLQ
jgi:toxin ParE1/3/4